MGMGMGMGAGMDAGTFLLPTLYMLLFSVVASNPIMKVTAEFKK